MAAPRREWWEEELRLLAPIMQRHLREGYMAAAESAARQLPAIAATKLTGRWLNEPPGGARVIQPRACQGTAKRPRRSLKRHQ